jgi:hypothetical protein
MGGKSGTTTLQYKEFTMTNTIDAEQLETFHQDIRKRTSMIVRSITDLINNRTDFAEKARLSFKTAGLLQTISLLEDPIADIATVKQGGNVVNAIEKLARDEVNPDIKAGIKLASTLVSTSLVLLS